MWVDDDLKEQIQSNYMLTSTARVIAEINLNAVITTRTAGVYQYEELKAPLGMHRPNLGSEYFDRENVRELPSTLIDKETPLLEQYFNLADCFTFRRPRAGIVYPLYIQQPTHTYIENYTTAYRPRNYVVGKNMPFKYWTSLKPIELLDPNIPPTDYKCSSSEVKNISSYCYNQELYGYPIANAAPAIIYDTLAYTNKIVIKIQTHAGVPRSEDDPIDIKWVPAAWSVQLLNSDNQWIPAYIFPEDYEVPTDGNIELMWGPTAPIGFEDTFKLYGNIEFKHEVNEIPLNYLHKGMAYILNDTSLYMWNGSLWVEQPLVYGWIDGTNNPFQYAVTDIVDPNGEQFILIRGARLVVNSMRQPGIPFDLIEISPRLQIDLTKYVDSYDVDKSLGLQTDLPISDLSNDVGSITFMNYDLAFSKLNRFDGEKGSIIADYMTDHTKILLFTAIKSDPLTYKYVPIKTMYVETWPVADPGTGTMSVSLRDYFMFIETMAAPDLFFTDISLTYTLATLFDNVGITNYVFIGFNEFNDINIPYFFCEQTQNLTDVLSDLVHAARCGIYFDEYNNLVVASKEYLSGIDRLTDLTLNGSTTTSELAEIESISIDKFVTYNSGDISFSPKYIDKKYFPTFVEKRDDTAANTLLLKSGKDIKYMYEPVTLWTLGSNSNENEYDNVNKNIGTFALSSVLLNTNLSNIRPTYNKDTGEFKNNTIDIGVSAKYLNRFAGFLYANGEIIKYDAVEYRISNVGDVWISTQQEYNNYLRNIPWNGWIDTTGQIRIWTEVEIIDGVTTVHDGRAYFGTGIESKDPITGKTIRLPVEHTVGGDPYWTKPVNYQSLQQEYKVLFSPCNEISFVDYQINPDANDRWNQQPSYINTSNDATKAKPPSFTLKSAITAAYGQNSIKASALDWKGTPQSEELNNRTINYFRRPFEKGRKYQRFGTRMRIVGEPVQTDNGQLQQPDGRLKLLGTDAASGGLALFTDDKRQGYFLEVIGFREDIAATNTGCPSGDAGQIHNLIFYKVLSVKRDNGQVVSMPFKLWGANIELILDSGSFALESTTPSGANNVVDIEVERYGNQFDIYVNGKKYGTATDDVNSTIEANAKYFDESANDQFNGDDNKNIIKSVPQYHGLNDNTANFWGPFIRGDSHVLFENLWAAEKRSVTNTMSEETHTPDIFGEIELDNNFGTMQIDDIYRRHSLSGFIQKGMLTNYVNDGYIYNIFYEEFGTILRECYITDARYETKPTLYARILPTIDKRNPFVISEEQLGPYGTEFVIFNTADKGIVLEDTSDVIINGIVLTGESLERITVDQYMQKTKSEVSQKSFISGIMESRRKSGIKNFDTIEPGPYIQSLAIAEQILVWALKYFTTEKLQCTATIFANPMIQLGDLIELRGLAGKTIQDGTTMIVDSISYAHDSAGPTMDVGLREVL